jgi:hypothetical protein
MSSAIHEWYEATREKLNIQSDYAASYLKCIPARGPNY